MRRGLDEAAVGAVIDKYMARKYGRALDQFFQGTVSTVAVTSTGFTVTLIRTGESAPDGNTYAVAPGYVPKPKDRVEALWRDTATAWVVFPVGMPFPGTAMVKLDEVVLTTTAASISFPSAASGLATIPGFYRNLQIVWVARTTSGNSNDVMGLQFNADSTGSYDWAGIDATGAATAIGPVLSTTSIRFGVAPGGIEAAGLFNGGRIDIPLYSGTTARKLITSQGWRNEASTGLEATSGAWQKTAGVTSITLTPAAGSLAVGSAGILLAN